MVTTQAMTMSKAMVQRTALMRSALPTPAMEEATTCVVETGPPKIAADMMTAAEALWAAKPLMGRRR